MNLFKLTKLYEKRPDIYQQQCEKFNRLIAPYLLLSTEPPIFYTPQFFSTSGHASLEPIFEYLQDQTAYFLYNWRWDMECPCSAL